MKPLTITLVGVNLLLFLSVAALLLFRPATSSQNIPEPPADASHFAKGEYYFNAANRADGVYDLQKARFHYEASIRENPAGHSLQWYQLGRIDFLEGRYDEALWKFERQQAYFGDEVPNVHYMIGLTAGYKARRTGASTDWERGLAGFLRYLTFDPTSPWARTDAAWIYFSMGKFEAMLPLLEEGLVTHPDHPWLLNMYGLALMNSGEAGRATEVFRRALEKAQLLTIDDWGKAYPGNNPRFWQQGLGEFQSAIAKNLVLAESQSE